MIDMLKLSDKTKDRDVGDLSYRKLCKKESNNALVKNVPYVVVKKQCLFDLIWR